MCWSSFSCVGSTCSYFGASLLHCVSARIDIGGFYLFHFSFPSLYWGGVGSSTPSRNAPRISSQCIDHGAPKTLSHGFQRRYSHDTTAGVGNTPGQGKAKTGRQAQGPDGLCDLQNKKNQMRRAETGMPEMHLDRSNLRWLQNHRQAKGDEKAWVFSAALIIFID